MQTFEKKFEHYKKTAIRTTNRYYQLIAVNYYICTWSDVYGTLHNFVYIKKELLHWNHQWRRI